MDHSILADLERAELAARERRLAAEAEAERHVAAAEQQAAAILASSGGVAAEAVAAVQRRHAERADAEVARLDAERAALGATPAGHGVGFERAVELVVRAVLDEGEV